jgi:hypothetical protein
MVVPQVTYTRFLYSTVTDPPPPPSCIRTVNGILSAEVISSPAPIMEVAAFGKTLLCQIFLGERNWYVETDNIQVIENRYSK